MNKYSIYMVSFERHGEKKKSEPSNTTLRASLMCCVLRGHTQRISLKTKRFTLNLLGSRKD